MLSRASHFGMQPQTAKLASRDAPLRQQVHRSGSLSWVTPPKKVGWAQESGGIICYYLRCGGVFVCRSAKGCRSAAQERVISNPGRYRLCWCSDGSDCTLPSQYLSYAGILQIKWPTYSPERFFCELGQLCNISGIEGEGLGNNDKASSRAPNPKANQASHLLALDHVKLQKGDRLISPRPGGFPAARLKLPSQAFGGHRIPT